MDGHRHGDALHALRGRFLRLAHVRLQQAVRGLRAPEGALQQQVRWILVRVINFAAG